MCGQIIYCDFYEGQVEIVGGVCDVAREEGCDSKGDCPCHPDREKLIWGEWLIERSEEKRREIESR